MDAKQKKIFDCAVKLFAQDGLKKTTIETIAKSVKVAKATIYIYYKHKEDLFRAVSDSIINTLRAGVIEKIEAVPSMEMKIRTYAFERMYLIEELWKGFGGYANEYSEYRGIFEKLMEKHIGEEIITMEGIIKLGIKQGVFTVKNPRAVAAMIIFGLKGIEQQWMQEIDKKEMVNNLTVMFDTLLFGMLTRK